MTVEATFESTYTITSSSKSNTLAALDTYDTTLSTSPTASPSGAQLPGTPISFTAPKIEGYAFAGWLRSEVDLTSGTDKNTSITVLMPANNAGTVTAKYTPANIKTPAAPYIVYLDTDGTLQLSSWKPVTGVGKVVQSNMLFFQYGSLLGFYTNVLGDNIDNWGSAGNSVAFNPTSTPDDTFNNPALGFNANPLLGIGWNAIPCWTDWTGTRPAMSTTPDPYPAAPHPSDGFISSEDYHNQNASAGRGDPCKLIGLTAAQIKAGALDNGKWRMPTLVEQHDVTSTTPADHTWWASVSGTTAWASSLTTTSGIFGSQGFLPAAGFRDYRAGAAYNLGLTGVFLVSRPYSATNGYNLNFNSYVLDSAHVNRTRFGFGVRCLPQ